MIIFAIESMERVKGILWAVTSSSTFGLAPLFSLLLLGVGYSSFEVLTYRWGVAALFLCGVGILRRCNFRLSGGELCAVLLLSVMRAITSLSLIIAYQNIASGTASTIHFMYPLAVAVGMICFVGERGSGRVFTAIGLSLVGVVLLTAGHAGFVRGNTLLGIVAAAVSVFSYGGYIVGVRQRRVAQIDATALTCYVMGFGSLFFLVGALCTGGIRMETEGLHWCWILGLALPATALSNLALVQAIKRIGPTLTAVFGALEPLTAVGVGVVVFAEPFTPQGCIGILMIVAAVTVVILRGQERKPQ